MPQLPAPAAFSNWTRSIASWPPLANNTEGDCVEAAALHQVQLWTAYTSIQETPDDISATTDYSDSTGFVPATATAPSLNDNGTNIPEFLARWVAAGIEVEQGLPLHKLDGFAPIAPGNIDSITLAIDLFGGCLVGVNLPLSAKTEVEAGAPWAQITDAPGGWGGHCPLLVRYDADPDNYVWCITWGGVQAMTWEWWRTYGFEAWALLSRSWIKPSGMAPSGYTYEQLAGILAEMKEAPDVGSD
jgi:hypothetical protein